MSGLRLQSQHVEGFSTRKAQPPTLANREMLNPLMLAQYLPMGVDNVAAAGDDMLVEESLVVAEGNETYVLAVGLLGIGEPGFLGKLSDGILGVSADGQQGMGQLLLAHTEKHVGLVLVGVYSFSQEETIGGAVDASVMSGGDMASLECRSPMHQ